MIRAYGASTPAIAAARPAVAPPLRKFLLGLGILACHLGLIAGAVRSAEISTLVPKTGPALVLVKGEFATGDAFRFVEKTDGLKEALVVFQSPGGMVVSGLGIGRAIRRKGFDTAVPAAAECASACALAWLAGSRRFMAEDARIGFHTAFVVKAGRPRKNRAAEAVVADYLRQLELPQPAIAYITRSPTQSLNVMTMDRARDLGLTVALYEPDSITGSLDEAPAKVIAAIRRLPQVDLYGRNLPGMPIETGSADECEAQCTGKDECAAFTFNAARSACFLKASAEIAVTHPAAISGYRERLKKRIRRIDITIQEATDYPGNDIDRETATTFEACVISCGKAPTCKAFTYVIRRHECWLKNGTGSAEPRDGLVSGVK